MQFSFTFLAFKKPVEECLMFCDCKAICGNKKDNIFAYKKKVCRQKNRNANQDL